MNKLICGFWVLVLFVSGVLGCAKETVPARGVWDGRTYTNVEAGIKMTIPEEYDIDSDEQLIKWGGFSSDYFDDVKSKTSGYVDLHVTQDNSRIYIAYRNVSGYNSLTAEQYLNLYKADYKTRTYDDGVKNITYGDYTEKMLCGQTYLYCGYTIEGVDDFYGALCVRAIPGNIITELNLYGETQEISDAYLAFFDTEGVNEN